MSIKDLIDWGGQRELEKNAREQRILDSAEPHEYVGYIIGVNTKHILSELKAIRWLLFAILFMLITFAVHILPQGWWHKGWWS